MVEISPVGVQQPYRTKPMGILCHPADVPVGILHAVDQPGPAQHTRTVIEGRLCLCKLAAFILLHRRRISPVEVDHLFGQLLHQIGIFSDDVPPHHRAATFLNEVVAQLFDKADIGGVLADLTAVFLTSAQA